MCHRWSCRPPWRILSHRRRQKDWRAKRRHSWAQCGKHGPRARLIGNGEVRQSLICGAFILKKAVGAHKVTWSIVNGLFSYVRAHCGAETRGRRPSHFLTESIKASRVYSRIMIVVNNHGMSVNTPQQTGSRLLRPADLPDTRLRWLCTTVRLVLTASRRRGRMMDDTTTRRHDETTQQTLMR